MNTRTKRRKHAVSACLLAVIMTAAILISGIAAQAAADNSVKANHGAVKVYNYDYNALVTRLTAKYPGVFKSATVYNAFEIEPKTAKLEWSGFIFFYTGDIFLPFLYDSRLECTISVLWNINLEFTIFTADSFWLGSISIVRFVITSILFIT